MDGCVLGGVCAQNHIRPERSLTTWAAAYPEGFCREWADLIVLTKSCTGDPSDDCNGDCARTDSGALEDLASNEMFGCAPWKVLMREACSSGSDRRLHINVTEVRGCFRTIRKRARRGYLSRQVYSLDSQVAIGCLSKGRLPSHVLELQTPSRYARYAGT